MTQFVRYPHRNVSLWFIGPASLLFGFGAFAGDAIVSEKFQLHGFASQAIMSTTDNNVFGETDDSLSSGFTELGINASARLLPELQLSAQVLSRRAGEGSDGEPQLDYGFVDYGVFSTEASRLGIRIGRVKNPIGLYNDTRDVAFTRPSILLPQSIYFDRTRNLALSADGADIYSDYNTEFGDFMVQFVLIEPQPDLDTELAVLGGNDLPGRFEGELSYIGRLLYEGASGRWRLGLTQGQINLDYDADAGFPDTLQAGSFRFTPWILSAQYNRERWSLTGEYALRFLKLMDFTPGPDTSVPGLSYYVQGTYRFSSVWEGVLRYDVFYRDRDDRDGSEHAAATGNPQYSTFAKDWMIGLRWNITPSWMARAEYHYVDGTGWLPLQDNPEPSQTDQYWSLFALLISYRF